MKTSSTKNEIVHRINKNNIDIVCANNKTHHINNSSAQKKSVVKKDIFSLNNTYNNFFRKLIH